MALVKRFILAAMILVLTAPIALAGPNAGGVLVVHATTLEQTSDILAYGGLSGVACGQDGPLSPQIQECPPYVPIGGANPCNSEAATPTSTKLPEVSHIWYVLAAFPGFPEPSCPRLKALAFRIKYDPAKIRIVAEGPADSTTSNQLSIPSDEEGSAWPANRSGMALGFLEARTSWLQEIWWFAGYAYSGATDATFAVEAAAGNEVFVDDAFPAVTDSIAGFPILGLGGAVGFNPIPHAPSPVEKTSWGRIKASYGTR